MKRRTKCDSPPKLCVWRQNRNFLLTPAAEHRPGAIGMTVPASCITSILGIALQSSKQTAMRLVVGWHRNCPEVDKNDDAWITATDRYFQ